MAHNSGNKLSRTIGLGVCVAILAIAITALQVATELNRPHRLVTSIKEGDHSDNLAAIVTDSRVQAATAWSWFRSEESVAEIIRQHGTEVMVILVESDQFYQLPPREIDEWPSTHFASPFTGRVEVKMQRFSLLSLTPWELAPVFVQFTVEEDRIVQSRTSSISAVTQ